MKAKPRYVQKIWTNQPPSLFGKNVLVASLVQKTLVHGQEFGSAAHCASVLIDQEPMTKMHMGWVQTRTEARRRI